MILNTTTDTLEILLGATVSANQASFVCHFNEMSSSTLVPKSSNGSTNNTTPVTIISAPSLSYQRQLKYLNIENNDTSSITVTIRFNDSSNTRIIFKATIGVGENLIYSVEEGWSVHDKLGNIELETTHIHPYGNIMMSELFLTNGYGSTTANATTGQIINIGRSPKNSTSINVLYRVSTAGVGITWAEVAAYKAGTTVGPGLARGYWRLGFLNASGIFNSIGLKNTTLTISNCSKGDNLFLVFAQFAATTQTAFWIQVADQVNSGLNAVTAATSATAWRPSTNFIYFVNSFTTGTNLIIYQIN